MMDRSLDSFRQSRAGIWIHLRGRNPLGARGKSRLADECTHTQDSCILNRSQRHPARSTQRLSWHRNTQQSIDYCCRVRNPFKHGPGRIYCISVCFLWLSNCAAKETCSSKHNLTCRRLPYCTATLFRLYDEETKWANCGSRHENRPSPAESLQWLQQCFHPQGERELKSC